MLRFSSLLLCFSPSVLCCLRGLLASLLRLMRPILALLSSFSAARICGLWYAKTFLDSVWVWFELLIQRVHGGKVSFHVLVEGTKVYVLRPFEVVGQVRGIPLLLMVHAL